MTDLSTPTLVAREALKLMAARRVAPTPENFARFYHRCAGTDLPPAGDAGAGEAIPREVIPREVIPREVIRSAAGHEWGALVRELSGQLARRQTGASLARKREALERMLAGAGSDAQLFDKLQALARRWSEVAEPAGRPAEVSYPAMAGDEPDWAPRGTRLGVLSEQAQTIKQLREALAQTLELGVVERLERFPELAEEAERLAREARRVRGTDAWNGYIVALRQLLFRSALRDEGDVALLEALVKLARLLTDNLGELVEDDPWLAGQCAVIREAIATPLSAQRIGEAERRLREMVHRQGLLKHSLGEAKSTLKALIAVFLQRLSEMTENAAEYQERIGDYAGRLQQAQDLAELEAIVSRLMTDTRGMQVDMRRYRDEMVWARRHAEDAQSKVREVAAELERVSAQLSRDPLTGALNLRGLDEAMRREISRAERCNAPLSVGVLDLDRFQRVSDAYGRQVYDAALRHVFGVVSATLRPTDLVARRGDEELVILFGDTALAQAGLAARRLQGELTRRPFPRGDERLPITFSAGVTQFCSGDTQAALVTRAERAMHQARLRGGNRIVTP
jgi:diguanylate cyclase